jgi:diguanylate cyclase (GGDEF)-like protein
VSTERPDQHPGPHGLVAAAAEALARGEDDGLPALLRLAAAELGAAQVAVFARDPEREGLDLVASDGSGATAPDEPVLAAASQGIPTLGRTIVVDGVEGTAADLPLVVTRGGIELGLGAIAFRWVGRPSNEADAGLLGALADLVAVALDRSRLATLAESRADRADRLAMMDGLTGLANSRTLDRVLELEVARAQRQNSPVSVAVFDIDGFATLNEQAGHAAGDDALREVAAALAGSVRLVDTVARTGADEFVVVAPGSAGRTVAERIVEAVGSLPSDAARRVTVSAGIARFPEDGASSEDLLRSARGALETARATGSGRIAGGDGSAAA